MGRQPCGLKVSNPIYVEHTGNLYEIRDSHSTDGHFVKSVRGRIEIAAKASLVGLGSEIRDLRGGKSVPHLILNRRENLKMTKTTKAMLAGAAFAGLIAGSGAAVKASTLLPSLKTSISAQEQSQDQGKDKKDDKQVKEKHACKGQNSCKGKGGCKSSDNGCKGENSCKGKGGCATDGSKKPQ